MTFGRTFPPRISRDILWISVSGTILLFEKRTRKGEENLQLRNFANMFCHDRHELSEDYVCLLPGCLVANRVTYTEKKETRYARRTCAETLWKLYCPNSLPCVSLEQNWKCKKLKKGISFNKTAIFCEIPFWKAHRSKWPHQLSQRHFHVMFVSHCSHTRFFFLSPSLFSDISVFKIDKKIKQFYRERG